ncbi:hypothetical protein JOQ06_026652, partial [Pogonophryne albipinna]
VNLGIFLNISRIIVQKTKATHVNQSDTRLYRTLLRSTLLLSPLFGVHYVVFALIPEHLGMGPRLYFELVLGSFQGFIVALLYCYLNGEVQKEIQRTLRRWTLLRSTLLLSPLFGVHYVVFALIPEHLGMGPRLYFELVLGSFQGFIVALLYCYLNGEVNLGIFLNISRIIVQKTKATHVNQSDTRLYRTLLRSTLLLSPLFGVHYVVFALIPEHLGMGPRLYFELVLGSFQGFIVALLYCYLNGEVQKEIQRTLRRWWPKTETNAINFPTQEYVP